MDLGPGSVVHIPSGVVHRIDAVSDSHFVLVR
jgi:quercetin dioxygenase-like cupin family protein